MAPSQEWKRRSFLQTAVGVPTLSLLPVGAAAAATTAVADPAGVPTKFVPVELSRYFNASPIDFGPHSRARAFSKDGLIPTPSGIQSLRGVPFSMAKEEGSHNKRWLALSKQSKAWTTASVEMPLQQKATYICLVNFCDWIPTPVHDGISQSYFPQGAETDDEIKRLGQLLAEVVLVYEDGEERALSIRRRFEVNTPSTPWNDDAFAAIRHYETSYEPVKPDQHVRSPRYGQNRLATDWPRSPTLWVCALENPEPDRELKAVRFEARAEDLLFVCGLTLFRGKENPLRHERLGVYRITLPEASVDPAKRWRLSVDLGVVARTYKLGQFEGEKWLTEAAKGLGEMADPEKPSPYLFAEITASNEATLTILDSQTRQRYEFDLGKAREDQEIKARSSGLRIEVLEARKTWVHGTVTETGTGSPTPVRLGFRSKQGRYIPPYGHFADNDIAQGQMYSSDLRLGDDCFAYVDGKFQIELPVGEVYVEVTKGFEYEPVRRKLEIKAGQRELKLEIGRFTDLRSRGWVTADTHVHFLTPATAVLEAEAEGLNLVNLLVTQWGNLFSNVGDRSYGNLVSPDGEAMVRVGSENRNHVLGHFGLLGEPVFPLSTDGAHEGSVGSPLWMSLAEMAEICRKRDGLAIAAHFPYGNGEAMAAIAASKIDAIEMAAYRDDRPGSFDLNFYDWYHSLNCGYRVPIVGGSDKMGAYIPVGASRAYAYLGQDEFTFENWTRAVRRGNTFSTTGPLLMLEVDGHVPGEEIRLGSSGGNVEVKVDAQGFAPFERVEILYNGKVVAAHEERAGTRHMVLREQVQVPGSGWLAARCGSQSWWPPEPASLAFQFSAHTSPVYLVAPGKNLMSTTSASYMMKLIDGSRSYVENLATRPDPERLAQIVRVFEEAQAALHRRLHAHGASHP